MINCLPDGVGHSSKSTIHQECESERTAAPSQVDWKPFRLEWEPLLDETILDFDPERRRLCPVVSVQVDACDADGICQCFPTDAEYRSTVRTKRELYHDLDVTPSPQGRKFSRLEWEPSLDEATRDSEDFPRRLTVPVQLNGCDADGTCRSLDHFEVGSLIMHNRWTLSKNSQFAYVWVESSNQENSIHIYSTENASLTGTCEFPSNVFPSYTSWSFVPVGGESVMARWGAGSGVLVAYLCTKDGELRKPRGTGPYEFSGGRRYAVSYPQFGTPLAGSRRIIIEDLTDGAYVAATLPSLQYGHVDHVQWEDNVAIMTIVERDEPTDEGTFIKEVGIPLP